VPLVSAHEVRTVLVATEAPLVDQEKNAKALSLVMLEVVVLVTAAS
jgi:hypothetical protein